MSNAIARLQRFRALTFTRTAVVVIILCTLGSGFWSFLKARKQPFIWSVSSTIMLRAGREGGSARPDILAVGGAAYGNPMIKAEDMNVEMRILKSPRLLQRVYERVMAEDTPTPETEDGEAAEEPASGGVLSVLSRGVKDAVASLNLEYKRDPEVAKFHAFRGQFQVKLVPKSTMIQIDAKGPNAERAKRNLEALLAEYQDEHIALYSHGEITPFFKDQLDETHQRVADKQTELAEFRRRTKIFDLPSAQKNLLSQKMSLEASLRGLTARRASTVARVDQLRGAQEATEPMSLSSMSQGRNGLREYVERMVIELEMKVRDAQEKFHDDQIPVDQARTRLEEMRAMLEELPVSEEGGRVETRNPLYTSLTQQLVEATATLQAIDAEREVLETQLTTVSETIDAHEGERINYERLNLELAEAKEDLRRVRMGLRTGRMNQTLDQAQITNVKIIEPPTIPAGPNMKFGFSPRVFTIISGTMTGFLLSLAFFLLRGAIREGKLMTQEGEA
ncbi:MAG: hypothetical protein AAF628_30195 [Planctomycetota bacterium]